MNRLRKRITLLVVVAIVSVNLLVITPTAVYACTCAVSQSPNIELGRSTAVFAGKVTDIQFRNWLVFSSVDPVNVTFEVSEVWKGSVQKVQTIRTVRSEMSCGYAFKTGKEYLVYARGSDANLEVSLCSRTAPLATAVTDIIVLGTGTIPATVAPVQWLPTIFFSLLGLFLIVSGLFKPQIDRRLGFGERSRIFSNPRFRQSARKTEFIGRAVSILLGLGFITQGIGNSFFAYGIFNVATFFLLGLAVIGILILIVLTTYYGWTRDK